MGIENNVFVLSTQDSGLEIENNVSCLSFQLKRKEKKKKKPFFFNLFGFPILLFSSTSPVPRSLIIVPSHLETARKISFGLV